MTTWRRFETPLFSGQQLHGIQDATSGKILAHQLDTDKDAVFDLAIKRVGTHGILVRPRPERTVFDIFLADVRMMSRASVSYELMQMAVGDMVDRWNARN